MLLKARTGLTKKVITNKAGKKQTVWVRSGKKKLSIDEKTISAIKNREISEGKLVKIAKDMGIELGRGWRRKGYSDIIEDVLDRIHKRR